MQTSSRRYGYNHLALILQIFGNLLLDENPAAIVCQEFNLLDHLERLPRVDMDPTQEISAECSELQAQFRGKVPNVEESSFYCPYPLLL